jgi:hypothetical protein
MPEITRGARLATIGLLILTLIVGGANLWATFLVVHANQAAQRRQGQAVERKICTTLTRLSGLQPPPGNPQANPSRAYLQDLHATLSQLGPDLGCRG